MSWIRALAFAFAALLPAAAPSVTFPRDHGLHPNVPVEWWYYTGHLADARGRAYGFQLTFFRVRDVHLAHFAWTDVSRRTFRYVEKTHLGVPGIASASEKGLDVSNEDWSAREGRGGAQELSASGPDGELELTLSPVKPPVLHGENGLSRKGAGPREFSQYVSITRLAARGSLARGGRREPLSGTAWFDHEWGSGVLPAGAAGWDWFALQLDDGSELMLYRMRRTDGSATPFSRRGGAGALERRDSLGVADLDLAPFARALPGGLAYRGRLDRPRRLGRASARRSGARDLRLDRRDLLGGSLRGEGNAERTADRRQGVRRIDRLRGQRRAGRRFLTRYREDGGSVGLAFGWYFHLPVGFVSSVR
ncbi:MAG: hypothetical protein DMF54_01455 [Acidobacteria bacterium]|nr:MAG: hypothetical protein DMF54_01455 [Acidobacteriota bacterium]